MRGRPAGTSGFARRIGDREAPRRYGREAVRPGRVHARHRPPRIGETCALRLPQVDLEGGTVEISATATAFGVEERPKTKAGWRVFAVPPNVVQILRRRVDSSELRTDVAIFPSPIGRVRDSSNTTADLRRAVTDAGFGWVKSQSFRKTVATRLDEAGLSARQIADHLGHAAPSMTQDVYMGRRVASSEAAKVLDR